MTGFDKLDLKINHIEDPFERFRAHYYLFLRTLNEQTYNIFVKAYRAIPTELEFWSRKDTSSESTGHILIINELRRLSPPTSNFNPEVDFISSFNINRERTMAYLHVDYRHDILGEQCRNIAFYLMGDSSAEEPFVRVVKNWMGINQHKQLVWILILWQDLCLNALMTSGRLQLIKNMN